MQLVCPLKTPVEMLWQDVGKGTTIGEPEYSKKGKGKVKGLPHHVASTSHTIREQDTQDYTAQTDQNIM